MGKITITITGSTMAEVHAAIIAMADELGGDNIRSVALATDTNEAKVEIGSPDPEPEKQAAPKPEKEAAPEPEKEAAPEGVMQDMTDAEALATGIKEVQSHFAANPGCLGELTALQKKYGVKMFTEIPEAKAKDFLADIRLMVSGAPSA